MRDVDDLIRAMRVPDAPITAPDPRPWWFQPRVAAVLLAVCALVVVATVATDGPTYRGAGPVESDVHLQIAVERGGVAVRATPDGSYRVGERVFFRVAAPRETDVVVWVQGPSGRETIGATRVGSTPTDLGDASGLTAYQFDRPGPFVFGHTTPSGECRNGCPDLTVDVR